jgi:uncharacterized protein (TIGR03437 family)
VAIYGSGLGPMEPIVSPTLAQGLANTRVLFNGLEAFATYVSFDQINAIVPFGVRVGDQVEVQAEHEGMLGNSVLVRAAGAVPGIFTANASGIGPAVVINEDGGFSIPRRTQPREVRSSASLPRAKARRILQGLTGVSRTLQHSSRLYSPFPSSLAGWQYLKMTSCSRD